MLAPRHSCHTVRPGLTLLEVLVSLAIFLFALVAIGQLMNFANDRAIDARLTQHAAFLCQSKLNEMSAGSIDMSSAQGEQTFTDGGRDWTWSATVTDEDIPNLSKVVVEVYCDSGYGQQVKVSMTRFIIKPSQRGSTLDSPPQSPYQSNSSGSSSSSGGN